MGDADKENGKPNLAGEKIKGKKGTGIKSKTPAAKKPNKNYKKQNQQETGANRHPETGIVEMADLF